MSRYTVNDVLDRVWNDSGFEEDISDNEFDEESDEDYRDESECSGHNVSSASEE